jgi:hypothetical protein
VIVAARPSHLLANLAFTELFLPDAALYKSADKLKYQLATFKAAVQFIVDPPPPPALQGGNKTSCADNESKAAAAAASAATVVVENRTATTSVVVVVDHHQQQQQQNDNAAAAWDLDAMVSRPRSVGVAESCSPPQMHSLVAAALSNGSGSGSNLFAPFVPPAAAATAASVSSSASSSSADKPKIFMML